MKPLHSVGMPHRWLALASAAITLAGLITYAAPSPASAATAKPVYTSAATTAAKSSHTLVETTGEVPAAPAVSDGHICLTNANAYCFWEAVISGTTVAIISKIIDKILEVIKKPEGEDPNGDDQDEIEDADDTSLCLADAGLRAGAGATFQPCGANGTVWILVPHSDGAYMYSRYSVDNGNPMVLTAVGPLTNDEHLVLEIAAQAGGADWQTWTYYPS